MQDARENSSFTIDDDWFGCLIGLAILAAIELIVRLGL